MSSPTWDSGDYPFQNDSSVSTGVVNVMAYDAKGDGVTDDTAAIRAAISALPAVSPHIGGRVFFPPGKYVVSGTLIVPQFVQLTASQAGDAAILVPPTFKGTVVQLAGVGQPCGVENLAFNTTDGNARTPISTTSTTVVAPGNATVTPASMSGIQVGMFLFVGGLTTAEMIQVTAITGTTFTATFTKSHSGTWAIGTFATYIDMYANLANGANFSIIQGCFFNNGYVSISNEANITATIDSCTFSTNSASGAGILLGMFTSIGGLVVRNMDTGQSGGPYANAWIQVGGTMNGFACVSGSFVTGLQLSDCDFTNGAYSVLADVTSGNSAMNFSQFTNCYFDSATIAAMALKGPSPVGQFVLNTFTNCWFSSVKNNGDGVFLGGTQATMFSGCVFFDNQGPGVEINGNSKETVFQGCTFSTNGTAGVAPYGFLADHCDRTVFADCIFTNIDGEATTQTYMGSTTSSTTRLMVRGGSIASTITNGIANGTTAGGLWVTDVLGYNPFGNLASYSQATPGFPLTTVAVQNTTPFTVGIYVTGGTISQVQIANRAGSFTTAGTTSGFFMLNPGESIKFSYTGSPSWTWYGQ